MRESESEQTAEKKIEQGIQHSAEKNKVGMANAETVQFGGEEAAVLQTDWSTVYKQQSSNNQ